MHDPETVAFSWPKYGTRLYRLVGTQVTIWHVDPETDGSDDSCGWSRPRLSAEDLQFCDQIAAEEERHPWFSTAQRHIRNPKYRYFEDRPGDGLALVMSAYAEVAWHVDRRWPDPVLMAEAAALVPHRHDNVLSRAGRDEKENVSSLIRCCMREYRRNRRRWWQHPRWHVRHWRVQIHLIQQLRRWLFARCATCGGRFKWNYCPTGDWSGRIWHNDCGAPHDKHTRGQTP